ncbi:hypothetical protein ABK040_011932 [Willaertia magna]
MTQPSTIKVAVVGNGVVGKTSLVISFLKEEYSKEYTPTESSDIYHKLIEYKDKNIALELMDTSCLDVHEYLKSSPSVDVFLLCFSVNHPQDMSEVKTNWIPEITQYCPNTPILLVGTKIDLRENYNYCSTTQDGQNLAKEIGAIDYCECSAKKGEGIRNVFDHVLETHHPL